MIATQSGVGIKLNGSSSEHIGAASGPTTIAGNFIGLSADGTEEFGNYEAAVLGAPQENTASTVGPGEVTVGGSGPGEANYIVGGETSIELTGAEKARIVGNEIGYRPGRVAGSAPERFGIRLLSEGVTERAAVLGNEINAEGAVGVDNEAAGAEISGNTIFEASNGIEGSGDDTGIPNTITSNQVIFADASGIRIDNGGNSVFGNTVIKAGRFGIYLDEHANHNVIGSDAPGAENVIAATGNRGEPDGGAIVVNGLSSSLNEITGNVGSGNQGPFIQLMKVENSEPTTPNQGISPPAITTALQGTVSGAAQPNATVRLFEKAEAEAGELLALVVVVKADGSGNWTAKFAKEEVGTLVAATQTSVLGGTSEVSTPAALAFEPRRRPAAVGMPRRRPR